MEYLMAYKENLNSEQDKEAKSTNSKVKIKYCKEKSRTFNFQENWY